MAENFIKSGFNYEKYIVVLLGLLIPLDYLGRGLFNVDLVLILVLFIGLLTKDKKVFTADYKKLIFLGLVIIFYSLSLFINLFNPTTDISSNVKLLITLLAFLYIVTYIFKNSSSARLNYLLFEKILFYSISLISCFLVLSFLLNIDFFASIKDLTLIEFNHNLFHSKQNLIAICIAFLINFFFHNKNKFNLFLLVMIVLGTFAAQGRTAIITMSVGIFIYIIYDIFKRRSINKKSIFIVLLFIVISIIIVLYISGSTLTNVQFHTSARFDGWLVYIDYILKENTFLGYGLQGGSTLYLNKVLLFSHPHNSFVEALFTLGVIGFSLFLILVLIYIVTIFKLNVEQYNKHIAYSFLFSLLLMQQGIGTIWGANFVIPTVLLIFLSINIKKIKR